jgi:poly(hydroxyalkanoate) depolymerase family esterase
MHTSVGEYLEGEYRSDRGDRRYRLYRPAPSEADPGSRPLIVMLHGCTQDADDFARGTRANPAADQAGAVVLYPEQPASANPQKCWNWFDPAHQSRGQGEPAILAGMTRQIARDVGADPDRIFVAGISAGGSMAQILAANYPDLYRALAVHSAPPYLSARDVPTALTVLQQGVADPTVLSEAVLAAMGDRARAMPTLVIHGHEDTIVAPANGEQVLRQWGEVAVQLGAEANPAEPARIHGMRGGPCPHVGGLAAASEEPTMPGPAEGTGLSAVRCVYRGAPVPVEYWLLTGVGHAWSGGSAEGTYTEPRGPDATARIFEFFERSGEHQGDQL